MMCLSSTRLVVNRWCSWPHLPFLLLMGGEWSKWNCCRNSSSNTRAQEKIKTKQKKNDRKTLSVVGEGDGNHGIKATILPLLSADKHGDTVTGLTYPTRWHQHLLPPQSFDTLREEEAIAV
uniref:Secreted protein n=1 Tax=Globodera rostochiensis TaxID=31243 RepID=A0A914GXK4_GLORO